MAQTERASVALSESCGNATDAIRRLRAAILAAAANDDTIDRDELRPILASVDIAEMEAIQAESRASLADGAIAAAGSLLHTLQATDWTDRLYGGLQTDSRRLSPFIRTAAPS